MLTVTGRCTTNKQSVDYLMCRVYKEEVGFAAYIVIMRRWLKGNHSRPAASGEANVWLGCTGISKSDYLISEGRRVYSKITVSAKAV